MARQGPQDALNSHFALVEADLQTRLLLAEDALCALLQTLSDLLSHLQGSGALEGDPEFVEKWNNAVALIQERGLTRRPLPGEKQDEGILCPNCDSRLRNVTGEPGDRCDWCGHVFRLVCPACSRDLGKMTGASGEICLGCQHQF